MLMSLNNGNNIYNYPVAKNTGATGVKQVRKAGVDLHNPMIGRIQFVPAGCGGCGK